MLIRTIGAETWLRSITCSINPAVAKASRARASYPPCFVVVVAGDVVYSPREFSTSFSHPVPALVPDRTRSYLDSALRRVSVAITDGRPFTVNARTLVSVVDTHGGFHQVPRYCRNMHAYVRKYSYIRAYICIYIYIYIYIYIT